MIPLIRPTFPPLHEVEKYFKECYKQKIFTNYGNLHEMACEGLSKLMGGFVLPVTSGTTALQVALRNLGLDGARVAVPDYSHSGTFLSVKLAGCVPLIVRSDPETWVLSAVDLMENASQFDAFIVVSPFGYYVNVPFWDGLAEKLGKKVIYDFAGAFGFFPKSNNLLCYSFHATKNFGIGEGGAIVHPTKESFEKSRRITNFGTLPDRSIQDEFGLNGKIDELRSAVILSMLEQKFLNRVWQRIQNKAALIDLYKKMIPEMFIPPGPKRPSLAVFSDIGIDDIEIRALRDGITIKKYYPLLSRMEFAEKFIVTASPDRMEHCYALPSDVSLSEAMRVVEWIRDKREQ